MSTDKYQLYEQIRSTNPGLGGGICIGVNKDLPSTLLREGGDEVECISVEVEVGQQRLVVVCDYGPQVSASPDRKQMFWDYLEKEVQEAAREKKLITIQMDANAWLGGNIIPRDPNIVANSNGKLFQSFFYKETRILL